MAHRASALALTVTPLPPTEKELRLRALERLYLRREAVDELIRSLENYQKAAPRLAPCIPFNAARKCS